MRLWSIHPKYLDVKGLVALWREGLLAQKVLKGATKGYKWHPQLERFRQELDPMAAIATYLAAVRDESVTRGYNFNSAKIGRRRVTKPIPVTDGQLAYEIAHLRAKLKARAPAQLAALDGLEHPEPHPLFRCQPGSIETWERP